MINFYYKGQGVRNWQLGFCKVSIAIILITLSKIAYAIPIAFTMDSSFSYTNTIVSPYSTSLDLNVGESVSLFRGGRMSTTFTNNDLFFLSTVEPISFTATAGGETITQIAYLELKVYNKTRSPGAIGATSSLGLVAPVIFDFSFGDLAFTRFSSSVNCLGCRQGETRSRNVFTTFILSANPPPSAVPLPASIWLFALGLLSLFRVSRIKT